MLPQVSVDYSLIQRWLTPGNYTWGEQDGDLSVKDWVFCRLVELGASSPFLTLFLQQEVNKDELKKAFQQEIISAPQEKKRNWIALIALLNGVPDWSFKLATLGNFSGSSDPLQSRRLLLTQIHQAILTKVKKVLIAIQEKQKVGIQDPNSSKVLKAQERTLFLFNGRLTSLISEIKNRECTLSHLQRSVGQALRFFRELQGIQMHQRGIIEAETLEQERKFLKSKSLDHTRTFEKNEKLLKQHYAKNPPLLNALLAAHAQLKARFFELGLDKSRRTPITLVADLGGDFKKVLDLNPGVCPSTVIQSHVTDWLAYLQKKKEDYNAPCKCAQCHLHPEKALSNLLESSDVLVKVLDTERQLMEVLQGHLRRLSTQWNSIQPREVQPEETLEEEEDPPSTVTSSVVPSQESSQSSDKFEAEIDAEPESLFALFLKSLPEDPAEKLTAFPMILRFLNGSIHPGLKSQTPYQESLSHVHLAHEGLTVLTDRLHRSDLLGAIAAVPSLLMDWHVQAEQLANFKIHQQKKPVVESHSLKHLFEVSGDWKTLPPELRDHLHHLDLALLWFRYPYSCQDRLGRMPTLPEGLRVILQCSTAIDRGSLLKAQLQEMLQFLRITHSCSLKLLAHCSPLKNKSEQLTALIALFDKMGWVDQYWQGLATTASTKKPPALFLDEKAFAKIARLLSLSHPSKKVDCKIKAALCDVQYHLQQLFLNRSHAKEAETPQAWDCRALMQIQWIMEQIYMARLFLINPDAKFVHDFELLQQLVGDTFKLSENHLSKVQSFNWGTGIHHPWQKRGEKEALTQFIAALEDDLERFGLEFTDLDPAKSALFFAQLNATCDEALFQVNHLLNLLLEELEAQIVPPAAIRI